MHHKHGTVLSENPITVCRNGHAKRVRFSSFIGMQLAPLVDCCKILERHLNLPSFSARSNAKGSPSWGPNARCARYLGQRSNNASEMFACNRLMATPLAADGGFSGLSGADLGHSQLRQYDLKTTGSIDYLASPPTSRQIQASPPQLLLLSKIPSTSNCPKNSSGSASDSIPGPASPLKSMPEQSPPATALPQHLDANSLPVQQKILGEEPAFLQPMGS